MIDFHSHILPQMDDGSESVNETLEMLKLSYANGVNKIIATPHFYPTEEDIESFIERREKSVSLLKGKLDFNMPKILLGAEVAYYKGIGASKRLSDLKIRGTNLIMIEMPCKPWDKNTVEDLLNLNRKQSLQPIIAHLERYIEFQSGRTLKYLFDNDVLFQFSCDFIGDKKNARKVKWIIKREYLHLLGSDAHNLTDRKPDFTIATFNNIYDKEIVTAINFLAENLVKNATEIK